MKKYLPADETSDELKLFGLSQKDIVQALKSQQKSEVIYIIKRDPVFKLISIYMF